MSDDILFIVNPVSGKKRRKSRILSKLHAAGCNVVLTEYAGHAEILAREAVENTVVAVGGDGTVNEVARGILGTGKTMGIIPCGSGDGLALDLGISRNISKALRVVQSGKQRVIDAGHINGRLFFSTCGLGLDAAVSQRFASSSRRGLATYIREAFSVWKHFSIEDTLISIDGKTIECRPVIVSVCNSRQWGNGARIAPDAILDDGLLDITIIDKFRSIEIPSLALRLMSGRLGKSPRVHQFRGRDINIHRKSEGPAHFDGDYLAAEQDLHIEILPASLKVIVPACARPCCMR